MCAGCIASLRPKCPRLPEPNNKTDLAEESAGYLRARGLSENVEPPTA